MWENMTLSVQRGGLWWYNNSASDDDINYYTIIVKQIIYETNTYDMGLADIMGWGGLMWYILKMCNPIRNRLHC